MTRTAKWCDHLGVGVVITLGWQAKRLNNELDDNLEVMFKDLKTQKAVGAPQGRASRARFTVHTHGGVHNARLGLG